MREIKFRGKGKTNDYWWEGSLAYFPDSNSAHIIPCGTCKMDEVICHYVEVRKETVGQFTGLRDRNGKEIYEGDILSFYDVADNGVVEMKNGAYMAVNGDKLQIVLMLGFHEATIVGNIHDNPELL